MQIRDAAVDERERTDENNYVHLYLTRFFGAVDCKQKPDVCRVHITLRVYVLDVLREVQPLIQLG